MEDALIGAEAIERRLGELLAQAAQPIEQRRTVYGPQGTVEQTVIELKVDFGGFASLVGAYCRLHPPESQLPKMEPIEGITIFEDADGRREAV